MTHCPRCGNEVDQLHRLPAESLRNGVLEWASRDDDGSGGRACRHCRNEVIEG